MMNSFNAGARAWIRVRALALGAAALAAGLSAYPADALAQQAWDGETSGDWTTGANWNGDTAPGAGDSAILDDGSLANQPVLFSGDSVSVSSVTVVDGLLRISGDLTASTISVAGTGAIVVDLGGTIVGDASVGEAFINETSELVINGTLIGDVLVSGAGVLGGAGIIDGNVVLTGGSLGFDFGAAALAVTGSLTGDSFGLSFGNLGGYTPGSGLSFEFLTAGVDAASAILAATVFFEGVADASLLSVFASADGRRFSLAEINPYANGVAEVPIPGAFALFAGGLGLVSLARGRKNRGATRAA